MRKPIYPHMATTRRTDGLHSNGADVRPKSREFSCLCNSVFT